MKTVYLHLTLDLPKHPPNLRSGDLQTHLIKLCIVSVMSVILTHIQNVQRQ